MDLWILKPGHRVQMDDGSEAVVLDETEDGEWIKVRYLSADNESLVGTEDLASRREIEALLGVADLAEWGSHVGVTLLVERGEVGYPDVYQAMAMSRIPHGVTITGEDEGSKEAALQRLISALQVFGFTGRVSVHDVTAVGSSDGYEFSL